MREIEKLGWVRGRFYFQSLSRWQLREKLLQPLIESDEIQHASSAPSGDEDIKRPWQPPA